MKIFDKKRDGLITVSKVTFSPHFVTLLVALQLKAPDLVIMTEQGPMRVCDIDMDVSKTYDANQPGK